MYVNIKAIVLSLLASTAVVLTAPAPDDGDNGWGYGQQSTCTEEYTTSYSTGMSTKTSVSTELIPHTTASTSLSIATSVSTKYSTITSTILSTSLSTATHVTTITSNSQSLTTITSKVPFTTSQVHSTQVCSTPGYGYGQPNWGDQEWNWN